MTVVLTVDRERWSAHVHRTLEHIRATATPIPVVKGNGYGFGRQQLAAIAAEESDIICVGTIHELDGLPPSVTPVVLTPSITGPVPSAILTIGHERHVEPLIGSGQRVIVKLASSMRRYGGDEMLLQHAIDSGLDVTGAAIHLPLNSSDEERHSEVSRLVRNVPESIPVWLSHISAPTIAQLPDTHTYLLRVGTDLWHGERDALHLSADVIDLRPVNAGEQAGYRQINVVEHGHLIMVGAGSSHGVRALDDGRSPFHFNRQRVEMFEPPHMHTTMLFMPAGAVLPEIGDYLDLQRPLTQTTVDTVIWR